MTYEYRYQYDYHYDSDYEYVNRKILVFIQIEVYQKLLRLAFAYHCDCTIIKQFKLH